MKTVAFCEIDPFCRKVLRKHWPDVPIYDDIRALTKSQLERDGIKGIDVVCGGFPCQPYSIAGRKRGTADHRDLWPEMFRIIKELKPTWIIGENVAHFVGMAFTRTKIDLESEGYEVQPLIIPACGVGAPHRRERVWILAYRPLLHDLHKETKAKAVRKSGGDFGWSPEPGVGRVANGIPFQLDRLKCLGNTVVPQVVEAIGRGIAF